LIIEAGIPRQLDYSQRNIEPLFLVKERLCFYLLEKDRDMSFIKLMAQEAIGAQLQPSEGLDEDLVRKSRIRAHSRVLDVAKRIYPWIDFSKIDQAIKDNLRDEAPQMIAEWYRVFEPENYQSYLDSLKPKD